jgi:NAD(P)-dependent dehydrogenase (short-subunit alcohol dehydrogenase family)
MNEQKVVFITGGSRGIGKAMIDGFIAQYWQAR